MKCLLMNKNTEVFIAEYDTAFKLFPKIIEIKNIDYAPLILKKVYDENKEEDLKVYLSNWFQGRGIPTLRDKLDLLLINLGVDRAEELLDKSFGLSLSDQYWIKPYGSNIQYKDINFFDHAFDSPGFLEATFTNTSPSTVSKKALKTPNNTTDGMLKKAWIIEDKTRYLLKGGYRNDILQPFNEVLASMICDRLNFDHVTYTIDVVEGKIVSKCACLTNQNTEMIPASQILYKISDKDKAYEEYIQILEENGIKNARIKLENMFILDYLIMNEDRHLNNFGIIRDVNTLKWIDMIPIFDNGQSLNIEDYGEDEVIVNNQGRFFYQIRPFDQIIKVIKNIKRIDTSKLDGVVEEFDELLHKYQSITNMSDKRISRICMIFNRQIEKLTEYIKNH